MGLRAPEEKREKMEPEFYIYEPVEPREHADDCRRGLDPCGPHYGLDRERCVRCQNLWARLGEAGARRMQKLAPGTPDPRD
jgi:hypothetical protein